MPRRELAEPADAAGPATIEAYTVMHSRDGEPETRRSPRACSPTAAARGAPRRPPALAAAMCDGEWVGRTAQLDAEGTLSA